MKTYSSCMLKSKLILKSSQSYSPSSCTWVWWLPDSGPSTGPPFQRLRNITFGSTLIQQHGFNNSWGHLPRVPPRQMHRRTFAASSFTRHMWFICISPLHEPSPSKIKLKPNFSFHSPLLHNSITRSYSKSHKRCCLHTPTHGQKGRSVLQLWGWSICNNSDGTGCSISQCRLLHVTAPSVVVATLNLLFFPT